MFLSAAPFARVALPPLPAFIPIHQTAIAISALITAALLLGQFGILGSAALLALAIGYLLTGFLAAAHVLTFPGLFAPDGLMQAGPQSTLWLYMASHGAFAVAALDPYTSEASTTPHANAGQNGMPSRMISKVET